MRSIEFEKKAIPVIMESIKSGKTTVPEQMIFQTQLLMGILMALNDMLVLLAPKTPQRAININTLPIVA